MRALLVLLFAPACSIWFDARDIAESFDAGGPPVASGPIVRFEVAPLSIKLGDTVRLVWETEDADDVLVTRNGDRISNNARGSRLLQPNETTTYRIEADGNSREITVFVDEEVPPEIVRFALMPSVIVGSEIDASWSVTHGTVSLVSGDEIRDGLPLVGSVDMPVEATSDFTLFAFAAGSLERTRRAFSIEPIDPDSPHLVGENAVELRRNESTQSLIWNASAETSLLPAVLDDRGGCVGGTMRVSRLPQGELLGEFDNCDRPTLTVSGPLLFEVALDDPPARTFFVPEQRKVACGNGIIEPPEECDDWDGFSGDGCSASCKIEPGVHLTNVGPPSDRPEPPPEDATELEFSAYDNGQRGFAIVGSPFPIAFYGRRYAGVIVHRNGAITFDLETRQREPRIPGRLPHPSIGHDAVIALASPFDGAIDEYDALTWQKPDRLVIDLSSADAHVQVHFVADGAIEIRIGDIDAESVRVVSGIQERTGQLGSNSFACSGNCFLQDVPAEGGARFR